MSFGRPPKGPDGDGPEPPEGGTPPDGATPPAPPAGGAAKAGIADAPLAIIISAKDGGDFDAGLATELMTVEAAVLGYGTKIISSPTMVLNGKDKAKYQELFKIPSDMSVKAVLLIGTYDQKESDAVAGATTRNSADEVVSYIK